MKRYVFVFSQSHVDFRVAEFESVCSLLHIDACCSNSLPVQKHVVTLEFESDTCVERILSRSMLIKTAMELISVSNDYKSLIEDIHNKATQLEKYNSSQQSFAIRIRPIGRKRDANYCNEIIDKLGDVLPLDKSPIDLENACNVFTVIEEYGTSGGCDPPLDVVYFGRLIGHGQFRLKNSYNLKKRCYIGNTTMDPELAFIQANLIKANTGSIVLDPFCGTGGLLISAAHFGAAVIGTEINYQIARAVGKSSRVGQKFLTADESVAANFVQYGTEDRFMSLIIADASRHQIWARRSGKEDGIFDAIVADPPYGVREKGRKVGNKERKAHWTLPGSEHEVHYPEKTKYALSSVFLDLLDLATCVLVLGGRLSFWFPVFRDEYSEAIIPRHDALRLVANCEQPLGNKYSRRLLVYEKVRSRRDNEKAYVEEDCYAETTFRQRIFINNN